MTPIAEMVRSQFMAALGTLKQCIRNCPEEEWNQSHKDAPFSQVLFHTLFYLDYYLSASEEEFKYMFPDCEIGAMPPFGNLYDMQVFVAESLKEDEEIDFNAGTHRELIKIKYKDFESLVKPKIGNFAFKH